MDSADKGETSDRPLAEQNTVVMYKYSLLLHALFVVLHLVAFVVVIQGAEKNAIVINAHFSLVSTAVTVIPQIVSTVCCDTLA
jgi:hypothetical protein